MNDIQDECERISHKVRARAQAIDRAMDENGALRLWRISRDGLGGYDTYTSAIVVSADQEKAKCIHPAGSSYSWVPSTHVEVELVGYAAEGFSEGDVLCADFHAG